MRTVALAVRPAYLVRVPPLASEQVHYRADAAQAFRLPGAAAEFEINERLPQRVETRSATAAKRALWSWKCR